MNIIRLPIIPLNVTRLLRRLVLIACALPFAAGCDTGERTPPGATLSVGDLLGGSDTVHTRAIEPREFTFPRDHGPHPVFRTEWWYFTGSLTTDDGRQLGYQLTFFRSALTDSASFAGAAAADSLSSVDATAGARSAWRSRHAWMAHFAVSDGGTGRFRTAEKFARGAAGLAGAEAAPLRVWLEDWSAVSLSADRSAVSVSDDRSAVSPLPAAFPLRLRASAAGIAIDLILEQGKPIVLHGERGLSRKGPEPGNASSYYSLTRMPTRGAVRTSAGTWTASGTSWLDREWSTSVLSPGVKGWDWLSLQLDDSTELMMYRLRRGDGTVDRFSAATFVAADGSTRGYAADEFLMSPTSMWRAPDGTAYPVGWHVEVQSLDLALEVTTPIESQELDLAVRYWEGMIRAHGTRAGRTVTGRGYLELTGYAGTSGRMR
jgi:predicted secreted hydrolase